jgi:hypothetical protein
MKTFPTLILSSIFIATLASCNNPSKNNSAQNIQVQHNGVNENPSDQ